MRKTFPSISYFNFIYAFNNSYSKPICLPKYATGYSYECDYVCRQWLRLDMESHLTIIQLAYVYVMFLLDALHHERHTVRLPSSTFTPLYLNRRMILKNRLIATLYVFSMNIPQRHNCSQRYGCLLRYVHCPLPSDNDVASRKLQWRYTASQSLMPLRHKMCVQYTEKIIYRLC